MWRFPSHLSRNNPHSRHRQAPLQIFIALPCPGLCRTRERGLALGHHSMGVQQGGGVA